MSASADGLGFFGAWQVINLVLATGIDAPWNKVQRWPVWEWFTVESVFFPTVFGVTVAAVFGMIAILIKALVD